MDPLAERTPDHRVLVFAPLGRDADLTRRLLAQAAIESHPCPSLAELSAMLQRQGAGALLLTEEAMEHPAFADLERTLAQQPPWSDVPVILLAGGVGSDLTDVAAAAAARLRNATVLERPIRQAALISALRAALRSRERQYEVRLLLKLNDALRPLADPAEIQRVAVHLLGEHFAGDAAACVGASPEGTTGAVDANAPDGRLATLTGASPLSVYASAVDRLRAGPAVPAADSDAVAVELASAHRAEHRKIRSAAEVALVEEIAERTWAAVERARAEHALRESEARLRRLNEHLEQRVHERTADIKALLARVVSVQEQERRRIARDIHDQLGQQITALRMNLEALRARAADDPALAEQTQRTHRLAEELDQSIDFLTWELRPAALDHLGLPAAVAHLVRGWSERFGIDAGFDTFGVDGLRFAPETETNLYRITQEALHNVYKHAQATHVSVVLEKCEERLMLVIEDNGRGFTDAGHKAGSLGLINMRERAMLAGGELTIDSSPGHGTTLIVRVVTPQENSVIR